MASVKPTRAAVISGVSPFEAARFGSAPLPRRNLVQVSSLRAMTTFRAISPLTLRDVDERGPGLEQLGRLVAVAALDRAEERLGVRHVLRRGGDDAADSRECNQCEPLHISCPFAPGSLNVPR